MMEVTGGKDGRSLPRQMLQTFNMKIDAAKGEAAGDAERSPGQLRAYGLGDACQR